MKNQQLVIIMGVTGAVGSALMEQYGRRKDVVLYGISRQARKWQDFTERQIGRLYAKTFICSLEFSENACQKFVEAIDFEQFSKVTYIHCVGAYLFEVDRTGKFIIENDHDADGINDQCTLLSYDLFRWMTLPLIEKTTSPVDCVIFGGLADKHEPRIIQSWWRTMKKVEAYMEGTACGRIRMLKINISSVFCPHELIKRPFVFIKTDANQTSWLSPSRLATEVILTLRTQRKRGFWKADTFKLWERFFEDYYTDENMVPRRLAETIKDI